MSTMIAHLTKPFLTAAILVVGLNPTPAAWSADHGSDPVVGTGDFPRAIVVAPPVDSDSNALYLIEGNSASPIVTLPDCRAEHCASESVLSPDGQHAAVTTNQDGEIISLQLISLKDSALHALDRWAWSRETATVTGHVSGVAWSIEGNLYFSKVFWATITDQKLAGPIVTSELWRVDPVAKAPALIIAKAPFYRVLAVEPSGMGAYVTILVSGYESWRSEALAYLNFSTGEVTPIWYGTGVAKPYYYAIRVAQTSSKTPSITLQYEEQVPGLTVPMGAIMLLTLDPSTRTLQPVVRTDEAGTMEGVRCDTGFDNVAFSESGADLLVACGGATAQINATDGTVVSMQPNNDLPGEVIAWTDNGLVTFNPVTGQVALMDDAGNAIGSIQLQGNGWGQPPAQVDSQDGIQNAPVDAIQAVSNAVVNYPVPYVHQLYDTPNWWVGDSSCGPTSAVMALAFYNRLQPKPITINTPFSHQNSYGWYVPTDSQGCGSAPCAGYSHTSATYGATTFNVTRRNGTTGNVYGSGAFGAVLNDQNLALNTNIVDYLRKHDVGAQLNYNSAVNLTNLKNELRAGALVILGTYATQPGHIMIVRGFTSDDKLIVNDPNGRYLGTQDQYDRCYVSGSKPCGEEEVYTLPSLGANWYIAVYGPNYLPGAVTSGAVTTAVHLANTSLYNTGSASTATLNWMSSNGARSGGAINLAVNTSETAIANAPAGFTGSVVLMPLQLGMGAVGLRTQSGTASNGATSVITARQLSSSWYVPQVFSGNTDANYTARSVLYVMNTSGYATTVTISFRNPDGTSPTQGGSRTVTLQPQATDVYNLSALPLNWVGSAQVVASQSARLAVTSITQPKVSSWTSTLHAVNNFPFEAKARTWYIPLFMSRMSNGNNTPVVVQNVGTGAIGPNGIVMNCTASPGSAGPATISRSNSTTSVGAGGWFAFNPVLRGDSLYPFDWYGSCTVTTTGDTVVYIQQRITRYLKDDNTWYGTDTANAGTYEAISAAQTSKRIIFAVAQSRLSDGRSTNFTLVNPGPTTANIKLHFEGSSACGSGDVTYPPVPTSFETIPANGGSYIINLKVGVSYIPSGWCGSLWIESDQPISGYAQLLNANFPLGADSLMVHNAMVLP